MKESQSGGEMSKTSKVVKIRKVSNQSLEHQRKLDIAKKYGLEKPELTEILQNIFTSRKVDDTEILMRKQGTAFFQISGAGHEGILSAVAKVLKPKYDWFIPYYRDRALCLGLGVTPYEMLCQANGNIGDASSHGRQMPAHFGHVAYNIIGKSSCTGTQFLQACGLAEAGIYLNKIALSDSPAYEKDEIVFVSCGDGTTSQGEFWEALTTSCVNNLPIMFLVEDNGYAISVPTSVQTPGGSISKALKDFPNLKIYNCNGNCPIESFATVKEAELFLRSKRTGPVLIHAKVTRPYSHSLSDDHSMYRSKEELEKERAEDVVNTFPNFLVETGVFTQEEIDEIKKNVDLKVKEAHQKAINTDWPEKATYADHLYSDVDITSQEFEIEPSFSGKDDVPMAGSINKVLKSEVKRNPLILLFGEDVADFSDTNLLLNEDLKGKGGVFKITAGVQREGVDGQVFNSPLAEANIIGRAIGMAYRGLKPVVEIQFFDYIWTAYMQLKNEMATCRYRTGGDWTNSMVVRVPIGGYLRGGSIYHSQTGESLFSHIPGIMIAYPSNALDAAGLLRTAIRADDPIMFLEHKHLYYQGYNRTADPGEEFMIPFGKARVIQEGRDATVVAWGALVQRTIEAVKRLEKEGYSIEVIDPRTIVPFDFEAIKNSLQKTNRLLVCHEEIKTSGFAGEICARVNEECFEYLDAPILRVTSKDTHVAYNPDLEDEILPQIEDVYQELKKLLTY